MRYLKNWPWVKISIWYLHPNKLVPCSLIVVIELGAGWNHCHITCKTLVADVNLPADTDQLLNVVNASDALSFNILYNFYAWYQLCSKHTNTDFTKLYMVILIHWGRATHICVSKLTIIGSAIIWTNVGILLIRALGTNFNEILMETYAFSFKTMHLKMSSGKSRPQCVNCKLKQNTTRHHLNLLWCSCSPFPIKIHIYYISCAPQLAVNFLITQI